MTDPRDLTAVRLDHALDRMWAGTATPDDDALIAGWIAADPARAALLTAVPTAAAGDVRVTPADTAAAWSAISAKMQAGEARPIQSAPSVRNAGARATASRAWLLKAAAVIVVMAGAATTRMLTSRGVHELTAPRGQRISATLPDGSTLTLAAGSRARWSRDFGRTERTVQLEGEAFFNVVHDTTRPFRVRARHSVIEDLGTRFAVRAWMELADVEIIVEEGRVSVRDTAAALQSAATELHAGQRALIPAAGPAVVSGLPANALAWIDGSLQFDNTPLSEALPVIERWYDVTIVVDPSLASRRLSARFEAQPIDQLLAPLGHALGANVVRLGPSITITPR